MKPLIDFNELLGEQETFNREEVIHLLETTVDYVNKVVHQRYIAPLQNSEARIAELKKKNSGLTNALYRKKKRVQEIYVDNPGRAKRIGTKIDKAIAANSVPD